MGGSGGGGRPSRLISSVKLAPSAAGAMRERARARARTHGY